MRWRTSLGSPPGVYAGRMGLQQALYDAFLQGTNQCHKAVLVLSGGRSMRTIGGMPAVELHTTGRKSGGAGR